MKAFYVGRRDYRRVLQLQETIFNAIIARQVSVRRGESALPLLPDVTLLVEHSAPVYTVGRRDTAEGLPKHSSVDVVKTRRGGGITYHGPGQLTMYPIANIQRLWKACAAQKVRSPIEWFSWVLEEAMMQSAAHFGIPTHRFKTGVWAEKHNDVPARKLGAIGLQLGNWVSMHGAGLNVSNDLHYFDDIIMCELPGRHATSLCEEIAQRGLPKTSAAQVQLVAPLLFEKFVESLHQPPDFAASKLHDLSTEDTWYDQVLKASGVRQT
ncbi:putative mitochondrial lipoate protein ligase [Leptomonas pyrrhocoris]|uniref:lipoyl(octanoyl) transferase n=1 Tax=Leptomonas pyrrhocoris TaxID=157538 RepID=A0A0M9G352_LEPPY|nr:putative mitochondrial lipoate protein ligase [Leptomonas pyrrhocoris]KPA81283.1 putative mitochondrial lipoate protein ligase [Leptomonas pyrrhocoris]|eukprot:XP_015659722.1 putative mitochondrial lipoate protein ligase [Leptomonas pyrrhocoris]